MVEECDDEYIEDTDETFTEDEDGEDDNGEDDEENTSSEPEIIPLWKRILNIERFLGFDYD